MRRLVLATVLLAACGDERGRVARAEHSTPTVTASLGDSVAIPDDIQGKVWLRHVVVRSRRGTDIVPGVLTLTAPVVVGDSIVYGAIVEQDATTSAFAYHPASNRVERIAWPVPTLGGTVPSFAPDGRHLAIVADDEQGNVRAIVTSWPRPDVILRSAPVALQATDFPVVNVDWRGSDTAIVRIDGALVGGRRRRMIYRVAIPQRAIVAETTNVADK